MTTYNVLFGFISSGLTLGRGDYVNVSSGGIAEDIVVGAKGNLVVSCGGVASATLVEAKGTETVNSGGLASGSTVGEGGTELVNSGGVITATVLRGGAAYISAGSANFGMLSAGNEYIYSGGSANGDVVSGHAKLFVFSSAIASGSVLTGGYEYAFSGGVVSATLVDSGGVLEVQSGGGGIGTVVHGGGQETVFAGGTATGSTIDSGASDLIFGSAGGTVLSGGENVYPGGIASGVDVDDTAILLIANGGMAIGTTVNSGGQVVVHAGAIANATMLEPGGTIDLPDLNFVSGGSAILDPSSDVLTITEGSANVTLTLAGSYAVGSFQTTPDNDTGTLITISGLATVVPRTLEWNGPNGGGFSVAADWIDVTNDLGQALLAPRANDMAEFLADGGAITGTGTADQLVFAGSTNWDVTSGASLSAATEITVGQADVDSLVIDSGASLTGLGVTDEIGSAPGGAASVMVEGTGSTWRSTGELVVGDLGAGSLAISGAASVSAAAAGMLPAMVLGANSGAAGSLLVTGAGSKATLSGQLDVGRAGNGTLTVAGQGTLTTGDDSLNATEGFDIGPMAGGAGTATVTGPGSLLSNIGAFIVGDAGLGGLSIANGAMVMTSPGLASGLAGLIVGNTEDASGSSLSVSDAGSDLAVGGTLVVGEAGFGSLSLSEGASVTAGALVAGAAASGDGNVSLVGVGSSLGVTGALTLGGAAAGELSILGGARMTVGGGVVGSGDSAPGNLDVEGVGSQLTINTGTLVIGANGPAEFTLGIGATLQGEVANGPFGVVNEYGNVDPPTDPNDGTQNVGFGNSLIYDFYVANSGTIKITSGTATFYAPLATDETSAADGSTSGLWVIGAHDTLVMNTTSVDQTQTFDFTSPSAASLAIGQVPQASGTQFDTFNGQTLPSLTGSITPGAPNVLPGWNAPIENYQSGDVITLQGLSYRSATASGDVVTVWSGAGGTGSSLGSLTFVTKSDAPSSTEAAAAASQINSLACFAAGTRIETADGWVVVEDLRVGHRVRTVQRPSSSPSAGLFGGPRVASTVDRVRRTNPGTTRGITPTNNAFNARAPFDPIVWIGSRTVDCTRHPKPETVWPVRLARGAFGENVPARDVYLSPDHAVFINDVLVPVKLLINGTTITQVKQDRVTYYHVELAEHAVILADGLPVESYLDVGDRTNFNCGGTIRLHPDFAARLAPAVAMVWETRGAAPLVLAGKQLAAARRKVARTAAIHPRVATRPRV